MKVGLLGKRLFEELIVFFFFFLKDQYLHECLPPGFTGHQNFTGKSAREQTNTKRNRKKIYI